MNYGRYYLLRLILIGFVVSLFLYPFLLPTPFANWLPPAFVLYILALLVAAYYTQCPQCHTIFGIKKTLGEEVGTKIETKRTQNPYTGRSRLVPVEQTRHTVYNECQVCDYSWLSNTTKERPFSDD